MMHSDRMNTCLRCFAAAALSLLALEASCHAEETSKVEGVVLLTDNHALKPVKGAVVVAIDKGDPNGSRQSPRTTKFSSPTDDGGKFVVEGFPRGSTVQLEVECKAGRCAPISAEFPAKDVVLVICAEAAPQRDRGISYAIQRTVQLVRQARGAEGIFRENLTVAIRRAYDTPTPNPEELVWVVSVADGWTRELSSYVDPSTLIETSQILGTLPYTKPYRVVDPDALVTFYHSTLDAARKDTQLPGDEAIRIAHLSDYVYADILISILGRIEPELRPRFADRVVCEWVEPEDDRWKECRKKFPVSSTPRQKDLAHFERAKRLHDKGLLELAITELETLIQLFPESRYLGDARGTLESYIRERGNK